MQSLYNEYGALNDIGRRIDNDVDQFIQDVLSNYYDCERRDIFEIMLNCIQAAKCTDRICRGIALRKEKKGSEL
jgi:hypothetical protein